MPLDGIQNNTPEDGIQNSVPVDVFKSAFDENLKPLPMDGIQNTKGCGFRIQQIRQRVSKLKIRNRLVINVHKKEGVKLS